MMLVTKGKGKWDHMKNNKNMKYIKTFSLNESINDILPPDNSYCMSNPEQFTRFKDFYKVVKIDNVKHVGKYLKEIALKVGSDKSITPGEILMFFHRHNGITYRIQIYEYTDNYFAVTFTHAAMKKAFICDGEDGLVKLITDFQLSWI